MLSSDPHDYPDAVWRDPSLRFQNTALISSDRTQVFPIREPISLRYVTTSSSSTAKRSAAAVASSGRRVSYKARDTPVVDPGSVVPRTPSEHSAPEEEVEETEYEEVAVECEDPSRGRTCLGGVTGRGIP